MKTSFKKFLSTLWHGEPKPEKPKSVMTIERDQAEFERDIMFNELRKRGFNVGKESWNTLYGNIYARFTWGALIGGTDANHDLWDLRYVDDHEKVQQEIEERKRMTPPELLHSLDALRSYAEKDAQKRK